MILFLAICGGAIIITLMMLLISTIGSLMVIILKKEIYGSNRIHLCHTISDNKRSNIKHKASPIPQALSVSIVEKGIK